MGNAAKIEACWNLDVILRVGPMSLLDRIRPFPLLFLFFLFFQTPIYQRVHGASFRTWRKFILSPCLLTQLQRSLVLVQPHLDLVNDTNFQTWIRFYQT